MGYSINKLVRRELSNRAIFNNRFVVEIAEKVHVHYRNLRINFNLPDFLEFCRGCVKTLERWEALGQPEPKPGQHIELCRRKVATDAVNDGFQVNLNKNLYNANKGKIYSEGAEFKDDTYIHLKIRDLRIELSTEEFMEVADAIAEAKGKLESRDSGPVL